MTKRRLSGIALAAVVIGAALVAINLHRRGHTTGDDWALYMRMAQSLFDGNIADVIADNRFLHDNSTAVTPPIYPWGWPVLLSPFVRVFGIDFGRLKLIEVAVFCAWLVLFHGIARRRAGRIMALALTAVFATSYVYLVHTDQLLSEFPHMLAVAVVVWWLDRAMTRTRLTAASTAELVTLGLLIVAAYNVRREGVVLVLVVAAAQLVDVLGSVVHAADNGEPSPFRRGRNPIGAVPWRSLSLPHLTFAAGAAVAQFLLPSTLLPDNDNSIGNISTRLWKLDSTRNGNYPRQLVAQLGLREPQAFGRWVLVAAGIGALVACARAPRRNVPLAVLAGSTMLVIGTHFRMVSRYYFQVTPLVLLFVAMLFVNVVDLGRPLLRLRMSGLRARQIVAAVAAVPLLWLAVYHATDLPRRVSAAQRFNDRGAVQRGPMSPHIEDAYEAIEQHTRHDDIIVYYRARTLTLYTGRRALQTTSISNVVNNGDYFMQNRTDNYSQPVVTEPELRQAGFELVWEDSTWRLWRVPDLAGSP